MRLEGIQIGDIVEVDRLGRRFHALVTGSASGGLSVQPLDRRITYRNCRAHDVVATRQTLDMVATIKGARPPARTIRGLV